MCVTFIWLSMRQSNRFRAVIQYVSQMYSSVMVWKLAPLVMLLNLYLRSNFLSFCGAFISVVWNIISNVFEHRINNVAMNRMRAMTSNGKSHFTYLLLVILITIAIIIMHTNKLALTTKTESIFWCDYFVWVCVFFSHCQDKMLLLSIFYFLRVVAGVCLCSTCFMVNDSRLCAQIHTTAVMMKNAMCWNYMPFKYYILFFFSFICLSLPFFLQWHAVYLFVWIVWCFAMNTPIQTKHSWCNSIVIFYCQKLKILIIVSVESFFFLFSLLELLFCCFHHREIEKAERKVPPKWIHTAHNTRRKKK